MLSLQDGAAAAHPTVGRLNATRAVACWVDDANSDYLRCAALTLQGATALAMGPVTSVRSAPTKYPSVAPLAEDKAMVCWLDVNNYDYGFCSVLLVAADGTIFATGPGGVLVFTADGDHLGTVLTGQATANCTLGDAGRSLYITADALLCRVRLAD